VARLLSIQPPQANVLPITRANDLLTRILGDDAGLAVLAADAADDEIFFDLDNMQLHFIQGGSPEDDCYRVSLFCAPAPFGIRTPQGLAYALSSILEAIRIQGEYMAENIPA
jgi:hypothetical protein